MSKKTILAYTALFAGFCLALFLSFHWVSTPLRPKDNLPEFASRFKHGKVYFEAVNQEVDIGAGNYFRDDGAVNDLDQHSRKLRTELAGLNLLPLEEINKIMPGPSDFVKGISFAIHLGGKKFVIVFYKNGDKSETKISAARIHEQTHALIRFGKIELIKNFLKRKNISVEYSQDELYRLCGLDPNKKHLLEIFSDIIKDKDSALAEFLAQKMQKYHQQKIGGSLSSER